MPAPKMLAGLSKPALFGLYGAVGGLLGALVFAEPLWQLVSPPLLPPAGPQLAVTASKDVEVFIGRENEFAVQIARERFDGPVDVRFENLPAGVTIASFAIPKGETEGRAKIVAQSSATTATKPVKVIAEAKADGKTISAETPLACTVSDPARPQADVVFVLDVTGSMQREIDGVRDGVTRFGDDLRQNKIDFRLGMVAFRDLTETEDERRGLKLMEVLRFGNDPFTADSAAFRREVSRLKAAGGGDEPESSLEALDEASSLTFRPGAVRVLLLITDAPPKVGPQRDVPGAVRAAAERLKTRGIDSVHLVCRDAELGIYRPLMELQGQKSRGQHFDLDRIARGAGFDSLLNDFGREVVKAAQANNPEKAQVGQADKPAVKSLQSNRRYAEGTEGQLLLAIGIWTGAIAALVCLALLAGQHHYLRGSLPAGGSIAAGLGGGLVVGLLGGAAGQGLFLLASDSVTLGVIFRILGWAVLGGLAGVGLSLFIPNMKWVNGLAGGALGGALGAAGFLAVAAITNDLVGRLIGGLLLGLCIGLMVAVVEAAFRRAWLEVRNGARETITVNLGPEPVKVGGDSRLCTVWARGGVPVALRYFIRNGQVICEDAPTRAESMVSNGDTREVGNVTVTVRTGASTAPIPTPVPRPSALQSIQQAQPLAAKPLDLPSFDEEPMSALTSVADAPTRPPVLTAGAKPPLPTVALRATETMAKPAAGPREPDACPSCGRKNPGRAGSRYCMVCDQTY